MKKLTLFIFFVCFFSVYSHVSASWNSSENSKALDFHSKHPPHDHQEHDHLKYIRSHSDRKKKRNARGVSQSNLMQ